MNPLRLLLLLALLCASCTDPRGSATGKVRKIGPDRLRLDAALLYKQLYSAHKMRASDYIEIRPKEWPASFQAFAPVRVGAYLDGFTLTLRSHNDRESGLYLVPKSMDLEPKASAGAQFEKLADGVYWYSFGQ